MADARALPHRRVVAAQRPADAVRQARDRPLRARPRTSRRSDDGHPGTAHEHRLGLRARARVAATTCGCATRYDLFIGGEFVRPGGRHARADDQPGHRGARGRGRVRRRRATSRAPFEAARAAAARLGGAAARSSAASTCSAIARLIQERARELAVVESLDGGKPIRESRDVDVPLAAAHFFHYAGWADKLSLRLGGRAVEPRGVVGQIVPWNFPLLMAAWKLAPALACGNTAVLKPAETTPLTALLLAEICQEAELPPGVVDIVTGDGAAGAALVREPDIDKVAFTGSTAVGKDIQRALAGRGIAADARARRQVGQHRLRGRRARPGGRGHRRGHLLQPGPRVLRGLAAAAAGERGRGGRSRKLWARMERLRVGDPLDKNTDVGAINSREQLERIEALVASGEEEGAMRRSVACALPERGYWFAPTLFTDVAPGAPDRGRGDLRPGRLGARRSARQAEAIEKANNSAYGLAAGHLDRQGREGVRGGGARCRPASCGRTPTTTSTRPPRSAATRRAASAARAGRPGCGPYLRVAS